MPRMNPTREVTIGSRWRKTTSLAWVIRWIWWSLGVILEEGNVLVSMVVIFWLVTMKRLKPFNLFARYQIRIITTYPIESVYLSIYLSTYQSIFSLWENTIFKYWLVSNVSLLIFFYLSYSSICLSIQIGTGFSDEDLQTYSQFFKSHVIDHPRSYYAYGEGVVADVWFEPVQVWEIKAADLTLSPQHKAAQGLVCTTTSTTTPYYYYYEPSLVIYI